MVRLYGNSEEDHNKYWEDLKCWSNACGDLYRGEADITEEELPEELARVYNERWEEDKDGNYTYLAEMSGVYGVALVHEYYEVFDGEHTPNNYDRAVKVAMKMDSFYHSIAECSDDGVQILLAKEVGYPREGENATELAVFVPASCSRSLFDRLSEEFSLIAHDPLYF